MAHYVITKGGTTLTVSAWSEQDAVEAFYDKTGEEWSSVDDFDVESIRPATVREAMVSEYGEDWQKHGPTHTFDVHSESYRSDYKDLLIVSCTEANNAFGYDDPVYIANYRVLQDRWSHLEGLGRGPWSNVNVVALELDSDAPEDLTDVLDTLADYPVVDEEEWSTVEQEIIQEHWDSYGKIDVLDTVAEAIGLDGRTDLTTAAVDIVSQLVWDGILEYGHNGGGGYPSFIDVSTVEFGDEDIAEFIKDNYGTVVTINEGESWRERTFDLTRANLVYL